MGAGLIFAGMAEGLGNAGVGIGRQMYADAAHSDRLRESADLQVETDNRRREALREHQAAMAAKVEAMYNEKINGAMAEGQQQIDPKSAAMDKMGIARSIGAEDVAEGYRKDFDTMAKRDTAEATADYYRSAKERQAADSKERTELNRQDNERKNRWTQAQIDIMKNPPPDPKADARILERHDTELGHNYKIPNESGTGSMPDAQAINAVKLVRDRMEDRLANPRAAVSFANEFARSIGQEKLRTLTTDQLYALADAYAAEKSGLRPKSDPVAPKTEPPKERASAPKSAASDLPAHEQGLIATLRRNLPRLTSDIEELRQQNLSGRIVPPSAPR